MINVDNLTGAYSRNYLEYILKKRLIKLNKAKSTPFSGVFIDLDDFKGINDKYGHMEGDFALKQTKV
jgi:diguanylate cyclase (GGDEF)-like protein